MLPFLAPTESAMKIHGVIAELRLLKSGVATCNMTRKQLHNATSQIM